MNSIRPKSMSCLVRLFLVLPVFYIGFLGFTKATAPPKTEVPTAGSKPLLVEIGGSSIKEFQKLAATSSLPAVTKTTASSSPANTASSDKHYAEIAKQSRELVDAVIGRNPKLKDNIKVSINEQPYQQATLADTDGVYTVRVSFDTNDKPVKLDIWWSMPQAGSGSFQVTDYGLRGRVSRLVFPNGSACYDDRFTQGGFESILRTCIRLLKNG